MHIPCQTFKKVPGGNSPTNWEDSPNWVERIAPVGGANRPTTYGGVGGDLPHPPHALGAALRDPCRIGPARSAPPSDHIGNTIRALGAALGAAGFCRNHRATLSMETPEKTSIRQTSARVYPSFRTENPCVAGSIPALSTANFGKPHAARHTVESAPR
jgi:hypothetical protein